MLATIYSKTVRERTFGLLIGVMSVSAMVALAVWVYSDLDQVIAEFAASFPDAYLSAMGISVDGTGTSIVLGEMLNLIAPMVLGGLAISIGTSAIAGEERDSTIGLLLSNPKSRATVLLAKTRAMLAVVAVGSLLIWLGSAASVALVGSNTVGLSIGAMSVHVFAISLFFGTLALFIGSWTGNAGAASGASAGLLIFSFLAAGFLPLIQGWENVAKVFPWYYFNSSQPLQNGLKPGHLAVLVGVSALLIGGAVVGVNRRDLRSGGVDGNLLERLLQNHPRVAAYAEKITGKAQVANIAIKTLSDHQGGATISAAAIFYTALIMGPFFNALKGVLSDLMSAMPEGLLAIVGSVDMSTPAGWFHGELFSMVVPGAIGAITIMMGARALAGEEKSQTMDLLLVNPIKRSRVVIEKSIAVLSMAFLLGFATFAGTAAGSLLGGLDISMLNIAGAAAQAFAFGFFLGAVALVGGAVTGNVKAAAYVGIGVGLVGFVIASYFPVSANLAEWARVSPFYYYAQNQPLSNGISWTNMGVLLGAGVLAVAASVLFFERRDIRN